MSTICLSMIVRDESAVIERCLDSVRPLIDCWCIVDTGSQDDTESKICAYFQRHGMAGELHKRVWIDDFGHSREQALELAKPLADYSLFIDADEVLTAEDGSALTKEHGQRLRQQLKSLQCQLGLYNVSFDGVEYPRFFVCDNRLPFHWHDPVHEFLSCDEPCKQVLFSWIVNLPRSDGARSKDAKYKRDAAVLRKQIAQHGQKPRWLFYLAQTLQCDGQTEAAIEAYQQRLALPRGSDQETYVAHLRLGQLLAEKKPDNALLHWAKAYDLDRDRAEAPLLAGRLLRTLGLPRAAMIWLSKAQACKRALGKLFVMPEAYGWAADLEAARCLHVDPKATAQELEQCVALLDKLQCSEDAPQVAREAAVSALGQVLRRPHFSSLALATRFQPSVIVVNDFLDNCDRVTDLAPRLIGREIPTHGYVESKLVQLLGQDLQLISSRIVRISGKLETTGLSAQLMLTDQHDSWASSEGVMVPWLANRLVLGNNICLQAEEQLVWTMQIK